MLVTYKADKVRSSDVAVARQHAFNSAVSRNEQGRLLWSLT